MVAPVKTLPETGETLRREVRPWTHTSQDRSMTVDVPGYCPEGSGKGVHVGDDMAPSRPKALRSRRHDRKYTLEELCQLIDESINSSISERSPDEILTRGDGWKPFLYGGVTSTIKERDRFHLKVKYSTSRTTEASHGTARNDRE